MPALAVPWADQVATSPIERARDFVSSRVTQPSQPEVRMGGNALVTSRSFDSNRGGSMARPNTFIRDRRGVSPTTSSTAPVTGDGPLRIRMTALGRQGRGELAGGYPRATVHGGLARELRPRRRRRSGSSVGGRGGLSGNARLP